MGRRLSAFKVRQLWWRKTTRNHIERLKAVGKWHGLPRLTLNEWMQRWEQFDHRCVYCWTKFDQIRDVTVEHLVGIKEGGEHRIHNCVPACLKCNQKKGDRTLEQFTGLNASEFVDKKLEELAEVLARERESNG